MPCPLRKFKTTNKYKNKKQVTKVIFVSCQKSNKINNKDEFTTYLNYKQIYRKVIRAPKANNLNITSDNLLKSAWKISFGKRCKF